MLKGPIVKYAGIFTDNQKQVIGQTATSIEDICEMDPVPIGFGARWLAVAQDIGPGRRFFIASRVGVENVMIGETVDELVDDIKRTFEDRMPSPERHRRDGIDGDGTDRRRSTDARRAL